ncbi:tetratricopeptide repeat protein [Legionella oakridgensis]|uniref:Uncharacterized protein n=2 Tax=Legionella oakridgensis TaxID=29423 RepID=W0BAL6_9GAMM|nr:hypothetical protein [Legionella oakridgensis]AHE66880.1 hypothetical protein Loa_01327 [Legionella oakridgensis ATCC 33761 = DSM 21215]KTD39767.1 hypothetical protein Loak_0874 [Legionella oakridgensis]STY19988.1 Uncharacterized enzyme of heme biosynthesis [Legionella longbeachae]
MLRKWVIILIGVLLLIMATLFYFAMKQAKKLHRDPIVLMNKYYRLKQSNPEAAKNALLIVLNQDNNYLPAHKEFSQWLLNGDNVQQALHSLERIDNLLPDNDDVYALQLGYLYYLNGDWEKSTRLYVRMMEHVKGTVKLQAQQALNAMASYLPFYQDYAFVEDVPALYASAEWFIKGSVIDCCTEPTVFFANLKTIPHESKNNIEPAKEANVLLNDDRFKKKDIAVSSRFLKHAIDKQPDNIQTLKEAGYAAIRKGKKIKAIHYFTQAYNESNEPSLAMQLAYLYDQINNKPAAYQYFKLASRSLDKNLSFQAENALTILGGQQTKVLPSPYFSEIYFNPFTQSRFGLTVRPFVFRIGIEQHDLMQSRTYLFFRRTDDNRSKNLGEISQIYEDNVQIMGIGGQVTPFRGLPIVGFVETGAAYDLVYRDRNRWRGDLRGGFMYYQEYGARPAYFDKLQISFCYYSDWYADVTYFSRYKNDVIGLIRTHQGIHLLQYHSSLLNLYMTGRVIADTRREFFNNLAEVGPGIAFVPSNRFNLQLRFEHIKGAYLPVGGASINPYGKYYSNNLVQLHFYVTM